MVYRTVRGRRGCGMRKQNALYLCVGLSPRGRPVEDFLLDPVRPFVGNAFRAPMILEREEAAPDALVWIGESHYPFVPDFVEEQRKLGLSRRIPRNFPFERLIPFESRVILVHPKARMVGEYEILWHTGSDYSMLEGKCRIPLQSHQCVFDLWPLSLAHSVRGHEVDGRIVRTPSVSYIVPDAEVSGRVVYEKGAFAAFHITHLEWVNRKGKCPVDLVSRAREIGLTIEVMEE